MSAIPLLQLLLWYALTLVCIISTLNKYQLNAGIVYSMSFSDYIYLTAIVLFSVPNNEGAVSTSVLPLAAEKCFCIDLRLTKLFDAVRRKLISHMMHMLNYMLSVRIIRVFRASQMAKWLMIFLDVTWATVTFLVKPT